MRQFIALCLGVICVPLISYSGSTWASEASTPIIAADNPYLGMSLEDLMQVQVSVASKKPQTLQDTAAAVFVLNHEDIRRSGATSIPEVLRLVPGVQVARLYGHAWAITSRGFISTFSNKLLVLIDGRSVFSPLFSGVYWDIQNVMLEDVDRIEVVRGSGGATWGANAVNGVINIITKSAHATQGGLLVAGGGNDEKGFGAGRYGFALGENGAARIYAKGFSRKDANSRNPGAVPNWKEQRGGFRADWDWGKQQAMLDGAIYSGSESAVSTIFQPNFNNPVVTYAAKTSGGHLLGRWQDDGLSLQVYVDRTKRERLTFSESRNTMDIEAKYRFSPFKNHDIQLGLGYRRTHDNIPGTFGLSFTPISRTDYLYSSFIQDQMSLSRDVDLTLGAKFEHNDYSGLEWAPTARLMWRASENHRIWAAYSRAYVPPSRADRSLQEKFVNSPGFQMGLVPSPNMQTTHMTAYELGYRGNFGSRWSVDATVFLNDYRLLPTIETLPFKAGFLGLQSANFLNARAYGSEWSVRTQLTPDWRLTAAYTWLLIHGTRTGGNDTTTVTEFAAPRNQWSLNSAWDMSDTLTLDAQYYWMGRLDLKPVIKSYQRLDLRLGWKPVNGIEASLTVQNALNHKHAEAWRKNIYGRSFYAKIVWTF